MSSNLKVNSIVPATGTNVAIGTAGGTITYSGSLTGITSVSTSNLTVNGNDYPSAGPLSNRNKITNGAMVVDQRNAGASVSVSGDGYGNRQFPVDRFNIQKNSTCVISGIQTSDVPTGQGLNYALKAQVTTADASIAAADYGFTSYRCEGYDVADFQFGTASAKTITISFWVKSSISGTYGFSLTNYADNRAIPINYSINSADTWEYKTITISGDTTGTWEKTNSGGMNIQWALGFGTDYEGTNNTWTGSVKLGTSSQTQWISTLNATFYLTGVQLEVGSVATPFEHRSYGDELARCQRYCYAAVADGSIDNYAPLATGRFYNASDAQFNIFFPVTMRTPPTLDSATTAAGTFFYNTGGGFGGVEATTIALNERAYNSATVYAQGASGQTAGNGTTLYSHDAEVAKLIFTAEL